MTETQMNSKIFNANEWAMTYYPMSAGECPKENAIEHSILKWRGLQKDILGNNFPPIEVSSSTCALCKWHNSDDCETCPIKIYHGRTCGVEWANWRGDNDPAPMLKLLESTRDKEMEIKKANIVLKLDENIEYRTRGGKKAIYIGYKLGGCRPHLFIVKGECADGGDFPIAVTSEFKYIDDNHDYHLDIINYYTDWNAVEVDTKVFVRDSESDNWIPRYFSEYKNGKVYTFPDGATSFSSTSPGMRPYWHHAKLAE